MCLYAGCEASFLSLELLKQHSGNHAFSAISRSARSNSGIDIACNDNSAGVTVSDNYDAWSPPAAGSTEGHVGASSEVLGLPDSVGDSSVAHYYDNNSYAPYTAIDTRAQGTPAARLPNEHISTPFNWSDPFRVVETPFPSGQFHNFSEGSADLVDPAVAGSGNTLSPAAHWPSPNVLGYTGHPFATDAASIANQPPLTGPLLHTNELAVAESAFTTPVLNNTPIHFDIGPPTPQRPTCTECNQTFGRPSDLERHAKTHQEGAKVFQCDVKGCKYGSKRKDKLRDHVRRRHPAEASV